MTCFNRFEIFFRLGAGTNNAKIAGLLKSLANYYYKEPNHLFLVRIAQGMLFLGKGTISIAPYHSDRMLMSNVAMTGILAVLHSCLDFKGGKCQKQIRTSLSSKTKFLTFLFSHF